MFTETQVGIFSEGHKSFFSAVCTVIDSAWAYSLPHFVYISVLFLRRSRMMCRKEGPVKGRKTQPPANNATIVPAASLVSPAHAVFYLSVGQMNLINTDWHSFQQVHCLGWSVVKLVPLKEKCDLWEVCPWFCWKLLLYFFCHCIQRWILKITNVLKMNVVVLTLGSGTPQSMSAT